jgi:adenosylcobyric acid synthase
VAAIMLQGTGSDVGKSVLVAGLCRAFTNRGLKVLPFKPQNMSNNAAVTVDGGEIGRAQALQAIACRVPPHSDMNPVLLKPQADHTSQLIVHGQVDGSMNGLNFRERRAALLPKVLESYHRLRAQSDLVIVEGAGSPAEINLRAGDIANMGFARAANVPVILVGDINRGGVIASLVGTKHVLAPEDTAMIKGFLINKFRGSPELFTDGYRQIEGLTGWQGYGVIPWLKDVQYLPAEDAVALENSSARSGGKILIACPVLPHISNFDDLDPLRLEPSVDLVMVRHGSPIPAEAKLIILAGSKATLSDLDALRQEGWHIDIAAHVRRGGYVMGICGGYQMLGETLADPDGVEGPAQSRDGLRLLPIHTRLTARKKLRNVQGIGLGLGLGAPFTGYEMHMGVSERQARARPFASLNDGAEDGAISRSNQVFGTYVHGIFQSRAFRSSFLQMMGTQSATPDQEAIVDDALNSIAHQLEEQMDIVNLLETAQLAGASS